jgi:hypothetical protein
MILNTNAEGIHIVRRVASRIDVELCILNLFKKQMYANLNRKCNISLENMRSATELWRRQKSVTFCNHKTITFFRD